MRLDKSINDQDLQLIINQGVAEMCICPAELAVLIRKVRNLYEYEENCLEKSDLEETHRLIAEALAKSHEILDICLQKILILEKWDMDSMKMPKELRRRIATRIDDRRRSP